MGKRKVRMFFSEMPMGIHLCFMEGSQQVGKNLTYNDPDRIYDILRAAHAPSEDHQAVEFALLSRRPGSVLLNLTQEQYDKLKAKTTK